MLLDPSVRGLRTPDYPWAPTEEEWPRRIADVREGWGNCEYFLRLLRDWAPNVADDQQFQDWFIEHMRRSMSPGAALAFFRTMMEADITDVLPSVRVPTLILCRPSERGEAEYVRERIAGAELVELPGLRGLWTWIADDIHERTIGTLAAFARGEVLVSGAVKDLVAGSGLEFEDRGSHELKGVPGEWRLYAVRDS